jgi:hypothetical protein
MNADQVAALRALLVQTGWLEDTSRFATALRRSARTPHGLLIVGSAAYEPWHMAAHLDQESEWAGRSELKPTLVRWSPPANAPPHLAVGLSRLREARRGETLLVVSDRQAPSELLERVDDVRRLGATIFALDRDDRELDSLAHERLAVPEPSAPVSFDGAQHLVTAAAADPDWTRRGSLGIGPEQPRSDTSGIRGRLARLLEAVTGSPSG